MTTTARPEGHRLTAALAALVMVASALVAAAAPARAADPCDPATFHAIACENSKPGSPSSEWETDSSSQIQGFATDISVDQGGRVEFKVDTAATAYRLDIYRMGYYGGNGARRVATVAPSAPLPQSQPPCLNDAATGLIDCGNWAPSATWDVPADAVSGIYFARLVREDGTPGNNHIVFVVRDDDGRSDLLFQTSDTTWQAYNDYGGNSLYAGQPAGRAYKVSYNRPFRTRSCCPEDWVFNAEYPMVRWLEANGYDVSYTTGVDTDRRGAELLEHKAFLSVGHDEYWSGAQRSNVEAARDAGVHLAFFSGNEVFWKTRWEQSIDGSGTPYRTLVSYKETHADAKIDPSAEWTGTWRDPRFSPPADGGRPENALSGTIFTVNGYRADPLTVSSREGRLRFWRNTSLATLPAGQSATLPAGLLGYEWDEDLDNGNRPPGLVRMSTTTVSGVPYLQDYGSTYADGTATHHLTLYRAASGALVFGAGTVQWSWGLDDEHDFSYNAADTRIRQATVNLFADMGVQPQTLQAGLIPAVASSDTSAPTVTIDEPAPGTELRPGTTVTLRGTASDVGGVLGAVEVSVDGGATWRPAAGLESWTYQWTPTTASGDVTILARAADDSGNLTATPAQVTVSVNSGAPECCFLFDHSSTPATAMDPDTGAVELGVRFRPKQDGQVTGLRFYKGGTANSGTHTGHLWTASGTLLASATYDWESDSGWQRVDLEPPVAVSAGQDYVASYHAPNGRYSTTTGFFAGSGVDRGPLTAPADGVGGGNGLYRYGPAGSFPSNTWNAANYWVDVEFADTTPPSVAARTPADGAVDVAVGAPVTATFDEDVDGATVGLTLRAPDGSTVGGARTYDAATRTVTLTPASPLATDTVYTAEATAADLSGNVMPSPSTWSFTTEGPDLAGPTVVVRSPKAGAAGVPVDSTVTATFDEPVAAGTLAFELRRPGGTVVPATTSLDGSRTTATLTPAAPLDQGVTYDAVASGAQDDAGNTMAEERWSFTTIDADGCPCTIFGPGDTPATAADPDASSVELGVRFRPQYDGYVTGVRFYKGSTSNSGVHVGNLWSTSGQRLATVTFTNETGTGWQQADFGEPVRVKGGQTYIASYFAPNGRYSTTVNAFASQGAGTGPVRALRDGEAGPNGVYRYGSSSGFPDSTWASANYFVDVVFARSAPDKTAPVVTTHVPSADANRVSSDTPVTATFSEPIDPATVVATLSGPSGSVPVTVSYDAATDTVSLDRTASLEASTTYTVTIDSAADPAGNVMAPVSWSFTTRPPPGVCPCTVWTDADLPAVPSKADSSAVEVGVRLRPSNDGYITAIRFYKGPDNTGAHTGHLWNASTGQLLGTALFENETATGWQEAPLASPVPVAAGQTYIASYHAPDGGYAIDEDFFLAGLDTGAIVMPAHGDGGANGVYGYGPSGTFPANSYRASNYWVDVVLETTANDTVPPRTIARSPSAGAQGVATSAAVTATFSEPIDPASLSFTLRDAVGATVPASVTYNAGSNRAVLTPDAALSETTTYTADLSGATDGAGNAMQPETWSFTTASPPPPPPHLGPGGPIAVIGEASQPFSRYYAEILRAEGLNSFTALDIPDVTPTSLAGFDVAILGQVPLTDSQATTLSDWVQGGGNLIAMRPDARLAGLLGLTPQGSTLSEGYLRVDTSQPPGQGIVGETMQYHGTADRYALAGARSVATLYSNASTATSSPAVTVRDVGPNGGQAAAFAFDLARSVVYTRQGNPAWDGQERDGLPPRRSNDLFFGGSQADWVNLSKVAIPQADEQQRLLANLIQHITSDRTPLPRLWYLPRMEKAVVVATGDDHGNNGTAGRFSRYAGISPAGCDVERWECLRFTSYMYTYTPISNSEATSYDQQGFEVALHTSTGCADYTPQSVANDYATQLAQFQQKYFSIPKPTTNRTHCIVWSDWSSQADVALDNGVRLDTNYYYFPDTWVQDRPGFMTGSGMPMRFARLDGSMIDVYQAATQMTDESGQSYPYTPDTLLDRALGPEGYYGAFTANMHTDQSPIWQDDALTSSAIARGVPVITARQMLAWLDGRNGSSFDNLDFTGGQLTFTLNVGAGADGLTAMLPVDSPQGSLTSITRDGAAVTYSEEVIKGVRYATFAGTAGAYTATYSSGGAPSVAGALSAPMGGVLGVLTRMVQPRRAGRRAGGRR